MKRSFAIGAVLCLLMLVSSVFSQGRGANQRNQSTSEEIRQQLGEAIELLKQNDLKQFTLLYGSLDMLKEVRDQTVYQDLNSVRYKPLCEQIAKQLAHFEKAEVSLGSNNLTAELTSTTTFEDGQVPPGIGLKSKNPNSQAVPAQGYGSDLTAVIKAAASENDVERFGRNLLPVDQVQHYNSVGWAKLNERMELEYGSRSVKEFWSNDLTALQSLKPEYSADKKVATFTMPFEPRSKFPKPDKQRKIIFELVGDNWRLQDGAAEMKKLIAEQSLRKPGAGSISNTLKLEKIGTTWRLVDNPF